MRIITGKSRGLKLQAPQGDHVRPTSDRVKESVFSILGSMLCDAIVLDVFSGSGNLAIEAFSRGALEVCAVDNNNTSLKYIRLNVEKAKAAGQIQIYRNDALKAISFFFQQEKFFDIIFCDPPYNSGWIEKILKQIKKCNILAKDGIIVVEYSKHENFVLPENFNLYRKESYGETMIAFITHNED